MHQVGTSRHSHIWCTVTHTSKCLNVNGDYMDVWGVTPATHVPCIHQCQNKIFCIRVFVTLFSENFLVYYLSVHFIATFVCFKSHFLWLNHVLKQRNWVFECHEQNEMMCVSVCMCACAHARVCVHVRKYTSCEVVYKLVTRKLHPWNIML